MKKLLSPPTTVIGLTTLLLAFVVSAEAQVVPLLHAHSHNDYKHPRPLLDALSHGFTSIEADVLLIDGELFVGHDMPEGEHNLLTLKEAYLEPLARIVHNHRGQVYTDFGGDFYLMIDIKTDAKATYQLLEQQLSDYRHILSQYSGSSYTPGPVTVFLSGNRPIETIKNATERLVALDGRPEHLNQGFSPELMPVISENYNKIIRWNGEGEISNADFQKLSQLATRAHTEGKKLRLWAAPDQENSWTSLQKAGVDLINTDRLEDLKVYLLKGYADH